MSRAPSRAPPSRRSRPPSRSDDDLSPSPPLRRPPPNLRRTRRPSDADVSPQRRRRSGNRGYALPREKERPLSSKVELHLCVFHGAGSHSWRIEPFTFDRNRENDRELWEDVRDIYRDVLQRPWRRIFLFKKLKLIAPILYSNNGVPIRVDEKDFPNKHTYMHAYHHPDRIRPAHEWVDFFASMQAENMDKMCGLEFVEGLWAEKLALLAVLITIAIIVVSIVWCVEGGELQTVFTVMSFVLGGATAEIALLALYYQITLPG